jgi:hypothetical protein
VNATSRRGCNESPKMREIGRRPHDRKIRRRFS